MQNDIQYKVVMNLNQTLPKMLKNKFSVILRLVSLLEFSSVFEEDQDESNDFIGSLIDGSADSAGSAIINSVTKIDFPKN